jgi:hypothetical protein
LVARQNVACAIAYPASRAVDGSDWGRERQRGSIVAPHFFQCIDHQLIQARYRRWRFLVVEAVVLESIELGVDVVADRRYSRSDVLFFAEAFRGD